MPFDKNDPNINRLGRKGPNNATKKIKEAFALLLEDNLDSMSIWLSQVASEDPKAAMDLMLKMSERFVPKLSQQQLTDGEGEALFKGLSFNFGPPIDSDLREKEDGE